MSHLITKKHQLLLLIAIFLSCWTYSQENINDGGNDPKNAVHLKSAITGVGSANLLVSGERHKVLQSIGQGGITTKVTYNNLIVQQGFLRHTKVFMVNNTGLLNVLKTLNVVISPNPFVDFIRIDFTSKTQQPVHIQIYDTNGKIFTEKKYPASKSITVPMTELSLGAYLVRIVSGNDKFIEKILKVK
tara:strand:- start:7246 stop:7809 length:564 start_codon:yes stop_codon:yes gene_type:complete